MISLEGYWNAPAHRGTGLLLLVRGDTLIGRLFTLTREGQHLELDFVTPLSKQVEIPLTHYAAAAWPGDGEHRDDAEARQAGCLTLVLDAFDEQLVAEVVVDGTLVQRVRPSPPPPDGFEESFEAVFRKLI